MKVAVIMGSTSDLPKVEPAIQILKDYGVEVQVRCLSAHRAHLGIRIISPLIATKNPAPVFGIKSLISTTNP